MKKPAVAVVGPCASGKSTIVAGLRERGIDAYSVAQEHSIIGDLWRRREPDLLVYLDVSLDAIRVRRGNSDWPEWIYELQTRRLKQARENAAIVVDTTKQSPEEILDDLEQTIGTSS